MKKILPSILAADFMNLEKDIKEVEKAGADLLHVDIMDGRFVPNITIGPDQVRQIKKIASIPLDVHLMIEEPDKYLEQFIKAGSDYLTIHVEVKKDIKKIIGMIKKMNVKAGISLRPQTPIAELEPYLEDLDLVLVMSVNPGFGGQKFMPEALDRIKELKNLIINKKISPIIEVDGGVNSDNIGDLSKAGVNYFVAGNTIFGSQDRYEIIKELKRKIS